MDKINEIFKEEKIIKQFKKNKNMLIHPLSRIEEYGSVQTDISLYTLGHLWLYLLFEENGYGEYLKDILNYAIKKRNALFEWEVDDEISIDLNSILKKYRLQYMKILSEDFNIYQYREIDARSKNKNEPLLRLSRFLVLAELGMAEQIYDKDKDLKLFLEDEGAIINATYLVVSVTGKEKEIVDKVPEWFYRMIAKNMECYYEKSEMKYYPKMTYLTAFLDKYVEIFEKNWYLLSDDEQVIISKFLYSIQIIKELSLSLLGLNGILSAVSTRIIFDNYWQCLYLTKYHKVSDYRNFVLKRMRLHILKRDEDDVNMQELLREVKDGIFDAIPVNGDYFTKSAREYAIQLGIKEDYDKYYEFNSEFIHSSLTAIYSGIMIPCENPEHNGHLMIKGGGARLVDSLPGMIIILNKHIKLVNEYMKENILPEIIFEDFFQTRSEWLKEMENNRKLFNM